MFRQRGEPAMVGALCKRFHPRHGESAADSKNNVGLQIRLTEGSIVDDSAGLTMREDD